MALPYYICQGTSARTSLRNTALLLCTLALIFGSCLFFGPPTVLLSVVRSARPQYLQRTSGGLGFASIFVVSLPRRTDRRATMDTLRGALDIDWTYADATDSSAPVIDRILSSVYQQRINFNQSSFSWPADIDTFAAADTPLPLTGSDLWPLELVSNISSPKPMTCRTQDDTPIAYSSKLPEYKLLSKGRIACWHSHLAVIRAVANGTVPTPALILEDDVDISRTANTTLTRVWHALPRKWDAVFLGHCWSDQAHYVPLAPGLYPAHAPRCTHAYALSRVGARRLLLHLVHAPFAYSRALDQALAWLVASGRMHAFSLVPPVVVQRKVGASDVMAGAGSGWRERLADGVLDGNVGGAATAIL